MRFAVLIVALFAPALFAADEKPTVKEIETKDLKVAVPNGGKATAPAEIKSADELAKSPVLKDAADAVKKQVNFEKEKLVVFAWSGSGGDRIAGEPSKDGKSAEFTYRIGLTFDLRQHVKLFVVPKDAAVKVVTAK